MPSSPSPSNTSKLAESSTATTRSERQCCYPLPFYLPYSFPQVLNELNQGICRHVSEALRMYLTLTNGFHSIVTVKLFGTRCYGLLILNVTWRDHEYPDYFSQLCSSIIPCNTESKVWRAALDPRRATEIKLHTLSRALGTECATKQLDRSGSPLLNL